MRWDATRGQRLTELKKTLAERVPSDVVQSAPVKKRKGKRERMKMKEAVQAVSEEKEDIDVGKRTLEGADEREGDDKRKRRRSKKAKVGGSYA